MAINDDEILFDFARVIFNGEIILGDPLSNSNKENLDFPWLSPAPILSIELSLSYTSYIFQVAEITWHGHTPMTYWNSIKWLDADTPLKKINREYRKLLERRTYFKICEICEERNPVGWMHHNTICQSCAERELGVIH